jgi:prepilin-type N-terminal cleavage/methylation domain-containing protein
MRAHVSPCSSLGRRHSSGFTLLELVISIMLLGLLAAVGSSMIADTFVTTQSVNAENASEGVARYAMERLEREFREVQNISTQYCITLTSTSSVNFDKGSATTSVSTCGKNADGTNANHVTITWNSTTQIVQLTYTLPSATTSNLADNVTAFQLNPLTIAGANADNTTIRFMQIALTRKDPTSGQSTSLQSRVSLRN